MKINNDYCNKEVATAYRDSRYGYDVVCDGDTKTYSYETTCNCCDLKFVSNIVDYYCPACRDMKDK